MTDSGIDLELVRWRSPAAAADATEPDSLAVGSAGPPKMEAMSTSDAASEWDLTVPVDDAELLAEFRRHGVRPGQRVRFAIVADEAEADQESGDALPYPLPRDLCRPALVERGPAEGILKLPTLFSALTNSRGTSATVF
jgi:hypothetical protein